MLVTQRHHNFKLTYYIQEMGHTFAFIDPLAGAIPPRSIQGVILLAHDQAVTYNYSKEQDTYCEFEGGSIIVDPWRKYKTTDNSIKVIYYGNSRTT